MKKLSIWKSHTALMLIALLGFYFAGNNEIAAAPASSLYFEPATSSVSNGQDFSLDAMINPGTNQLSAAELKISFDPAKLKLLSIVGNSQTFPQVLSAAQMDNTAGTGSIILGVALGNPPVYATSISKVATFNFKVMGNSGAATVSFATGTQAAGLGEPANIIVSKKSAEITIGRKYSNTDFSLIAANFLKNVGTSSGNPNGDYNTDGMVDTRDIGIVMSNWQN